MRERLTAFANEYDTQVDAKAYDGDEQRSILNPLVFVFIGDTSLEALEAVYALNARKWNNSAGVQYLHIHTGRTCTLENVFSVKLDAPGEDRKQLRASAREDFYANEGKLVELNRVIRKIGSRISEFGRLYTSFQRLNIAMVTQVDDPCNVLLPEVSLLARAVFGDSFKFVQTDLYALIREQTTSGEVGFSSSMGVGFLRELEFYQSRDYAFKEMLQVTEDLIKLPVEHPASPLFDLVYLLSDKDERGYFPAGGMEANYEIICNMNLLKNRKLAQNESYKHDRYNNLQFKQNITPAEAAGGVYVTAGLAKVKRPNQAIALTVLYRMFKHFVDYMSSQAEEDHHEVFEVFEIDHSSLERKVQRLLPDRTELEELNALIAHDVSLDHLKRMSLEEAEEALYAGNAGAFFEEYFGKRPEAETEMREEFRQLVEDIVIPRYGFYSVYLWTSESGDSVLPQELRELLRETEKQLADQLALLQEDYLERAAEQPVQRVPFMNKANLKRFSRHLLAKIYGRKYDILLLENRISLLKLVHKESEELHRRLRNHVGLLDELDKTMANAYRTGISTTNDYLGRNIAEYYGVVVSDILQDAQAKWGADFYKAERFFENAYALLKDGAEALLARIIDVCKKEVFVYPQFHQSFEDELLKRANVTISYDRKDSVLSKEELYRDLYKTLDDNATVHMEIYNYTHKHRHEEKYFFGDAESEFIRFAFELDRSNRTYGLGCVNEKKASGVEKLNIMGGFQLGDLMYYRNGRKFYDFYTKDGFRFHAADPDKFGPLQPQSDH